MSKVSRTYGSTLSFIMVLVLLTGCEMLSPAYSQVEESTSITVVNNTSEMVYIWPLELQFSKLAYWWVPPPSGPDDPYLLNSNESVEIAFEDIPEGFEQGRGLFVSLNAVTSDAEGPPFYSVGNLTRDWEELQAASFRVEITEDDITEDGDRSN